MGDGGVHLASESGHIEYRQIAVNRRELLRIAARRLTAREEKTVRMRSGVSLGRGELLPRRGQNHAEAKAELLAMEIELKQKLAARSRKGSATQVRTKEKDKIIRALRRLK